VTETKTKINKHSDFRDVDPVWDDIGELEFPALLLDNKESKFIKVLSQKLFDMVNYMTSVAQFSPEKRRELFTLRKNLDYLKAERVKIIARHTLDLSKIPVENRKTKDMINNYIEFKLANDELKKHDDKAIDYEKKAADIQLELDRINERCDMAKRAIRAATATLNAMGGNLREDE